MDSPHRLIAEKNHGRILIVFLICADKFQTGYDEPLLHTMYVGQDLVRHQGRANAFPTQPVTSRQARRVPGSIS